MSNGRGRKTRLRAFECFCVWIWPEVGESAIAKVCLLFLITYIVDGVIGPIPGLPELVALGIIERTGGDPWSNIAAAGFSNMDKDKRCFRPVTSPSTDLP